ncbi:MAG: hypothetical protein ACO35C_03915 [Pontimonas sp.]
MCFFQIDVVRLDPIRLGATKLLEERASLASLAPASIARIPGSGDVEYFIII